MKRKINIIISAVLILLILPMQFGCNKDKLLKTQTDDFDPWVYDFNGNGQIDEDELEAILNDFAENKINEEEFKAGIELWASHGTGQEGNSTKSDFEPCSYDSNFNGVIDKAEAVEAINDYLFEGTITKAQCIEVLNMYLFGGSPCSDDFFFVHITDLHIKDGSFGIGTGDINGNAFKKIMDEINSWTDKPAFVIASGDISDVGCWSDDGMYPAMTQWLYTKSDWDNPKVGDICIDAAKQIPIYFTPGNHDYRITNFFDISNGWPPFPYIDENLTDYVDHLIPREDYVIDMGNAVIICMDSGSDVSCDDAYMTPEGTGFTPEQTAWLLQTFYEHSTKRKIIVTHHPFINDVGTDWDGSTHEEIPLSEADGSFLTRDDVLQYCKDFNVDVTLSGHVHQNIVCYDDNNGNTFTRFVQTANAFKGSYRKISVDSDGVTVHNPQLAVLSPSYPFVDSRDRQIYETIKIGTQTWMAENLNYECDGSYWYNNDKAYGDIYGRLYTWDAAMTVAPGGWHLPSEAEWLTLIAYLGGSSVAGGKMKSIGTAYWNSPNTGATNESGFTALPGGYRASTGMFSYLGSRTCFWSAASNNSSTAWRCALIYNNPFVYGGNDFSKDCGYAVRLVKGEPHEIINNKSFETTCCWTLERNSTEFDLPSYSTYWGHAGSQSMKFRLNCSDPEEGDNCSISQSITVQYNHHISFWIKTHGRHGHFGEGNFLDFRVLFKGNVVYTLNGVDETTTPPMPIWNCTENEWEVCDYYEGQKSDIDLSSYAGQTGDLTFEFRSNIDMSYHRFETVLYLDDITESY
ncbi:MAG: metallophosphoesterase [Bacteroidales bacterium]|nr:metallophosphoesterase [Bacteroidales bacterium]